MQRHRQRVPAPSSIVELAMGATTGGIEGSGSFLNSFITFDVAPPVTGDRNGDGLVNGLDIGVLLSQWGGAGTADLNSDGTVDGLDIGVLLAHWSF